MSQQSPTEIKKYWDKWIDSRDSEAADVLIKQYMPLVTYQVQRISVNLPKSVIRDELISFGLLGLYDALEKFDPSRDLKFDTYASFRVRGAILDGLRKEDWLPRGAREKTKKIEAAVEALEQKLMRNVTVKDIASELNMPVEEVQATLDEGFFANVLSIDDQSSEQDEKDSPAFTIRDDKEETPEENLLRQEMYAQLADVITSLNDNEQLVISLFYKEELTLTEIGQVLNLSTSRISQIHSKAIVKLKKILDKAI